MFSRKHYEKKYNEWNEKLAFTSINWFKELKYVNLSASFYCGYFLPLFSIKFYTVRSWTVPIMPRWSQNRISVPFSVPNCRRITWVIARKICVSSHSTDGLSRHIWTKLRSPYAYFAHLILMLIWTCLRSYCEAITQNALIVQFLFNQITFVMESNILTLGYI